MAPGAGYARRDHRRPRRRRVGPARTNHCRRRRLRRHHRVPPGPAGPRPALRGRRQARHQRLPGRRGPGHGGLLRPRPTPHPALPRRPDQPRRPGPGRRPRRAASSHLASWFPQERAQPDRRDALAVLALRVRPANRDIPRGADGSLPDCWLIAEWPPGKPEPTDYWLSNLPIETPLRDLVRLAKIRWRIEHDYRELKDGLGLDHFEGRSYGGWHRHVTLAALAQAFCTQLRNDPKAPAPA